MEIVVSSLDILRRFLQRMGPYLLVEILMPGGSVLALLLFLYRRWRQRVEAEPAIAASALVSAATAVGFLRWSVSIADRVGGPS